MSVNWDGVIICMGAGVIVLILLAILGGVVYPALGLT